MRTTIILALLMMTGLYAEDKIQDTLDKKLKKLDEQYLKKKSGYLKDALEAYDKAKVRETKKGNLEGALEYKEKAEALEKKIAALDATLSTGKPPKTDLEVKKIGKIPLSEIRFLDYINNTWENDISSSYTVESRSDGDHVEGTVIGGYPGKMILFKQGDPRNDVLKGSLTLTEGVLGIGFKPRDLAPRGVIKKGAFPVGRRVDFKLYIEKEVAYLELDGKKHTLLKRPEDYGWFHFYPSPRVKFVVHKLYFGKW